MHVYYALKYNVMQNPKPTSIHASPCWALSRISCIWQGQKRTRFCHYFFCNDLLTVAALSPRDMRQELPPQRLWFLTSVVHPNLERFDTVSIPFHHFHVNTFSCFCLSLLTHVEPSSGKKNLIQQVNMRIIEYTQIGRAWIIVDPTWSNFKKVTATKCAMAGAN